MNYFEFYDLPLSFQLDLDLLKKKFYENSRSFHPDFHMHAPEETQEKVLEQATINNKAFKVLSDFEQRLKYLLDLFGKLKEEGANKVPQDFLLEMMDLNECLMELEMDPSEQARDTLLNEIKLLEEKALAVIQPILETRDINRLSEKEWSEITDYYLKNQYLKRIRENIRKMSEG